MTLTEEAREELEWGKDHSTQWNGRSLIAHNSSITNENLCPLETRSGAVHHGHLHAKLGRDRSDRLAVFRHRLARCHQCGDHRASTYLVLLGMLVSPPLLIPQRTDLITVTHPDSLPEVVPQLAISGSATRTATFQRELCNFSWRHGDRSLPGCTTHSLESGSAGVVNRTVIPFHPL